MEKTLLHPMMPKTSHDEVAEQAFVADFKKFIGMEIEPLCRQLTKAAENGEEHKGEDSHVAIRRKLESEPLYQTWLSMMRTSQDMMWESVAGPIDRELDDLIERAKIDQPKGSLTLNPDFVPPKHLTVQDVHRMPGNYAGDFKPGDVRQGAMYDCGGLIYMIGGRKGNLNDARGHTLISHYFTRFPDAQPKRVLEMGCSAGASTVAMAEYFPDAEYHAIDIGAGMLRYAFARAELMGVGVHFSQQDASATTFDDESFDLVISSVMLHETTHKMVRDIVQECARVLKPGGVMVHLEVPTRYEDLDTWSRIRADYEAQVNFEPFWRGALSLDFESLAQDAGFTQIMAGYQDTAGKATREGGPLRETSLGVFRSWLAMSAVKPQE